MNNNPRQLIAALREGAYAHPGEEEAIEIVLDGLETIASSAHRLNILDVGCGLGGTAHYIKQHKNHSLTGVDIDKNAIDYAKKNFPDINFIQADITQLSQCTFEKPFDVVYLFNVLYQFADKNAVILQTFTKPTYDTVYNGFQKILSALQEKQLGGGIIYAIKTKEQR